VLFKWSVPDNEPPRSIDCLETSSSPAFNFILLPPTVLPLQVLKIAPRLFIQVESLFFFRPPLPSSLSTFVPSAPLTLPLSWFFCPPQLFLLALFFFLFFCCNCTLLDFFADCGPDLRSSVSFTHSPYLRCRWCAFVPEPFSPFFRAGCFVIQSAFRGSKDFRT